MSCREFSELISEEIDCELEESRALFLMRHVVVCDDCMGEYRRSLDLRDAFIKEGLSLQMSVPDGFSMNVMAMIESETAVEAVIPEPERRSLSGLFAGLMAGLRGLLPIPGPSLSWSFAASFLLVVSVYLFYGRSTTDHLSEVQFTDAKAISAKILTASAVAEEKGEDEGLDYYVKRHTNAAYSKAVNTSIGYRKSNILYADYSLGNHGH